MLRDCALESQQNLKNFDSSAEDQAIRDEHILTLIEYIKAAI